MIRMVKAFLPIFKKQVLTKRYENAQIANIISVAGMLSAGGFAISPYEVSKNAAESFTDSLRLEMKMFGIKVIAVNPTFHETPLVTEGLENIRSKVFDCLSPTTMEEYGEGTKYFLDVFTVFLCMDLNSNSVLFRFRRKLHGTRQGINEGKLVEYQNIRGQNG